MAKIYISGPITGIDNYMDQFIEKDMELRKQGHEVINPALINSYLPANTTHREYMIVSIALLKLADTIYMLKGWENSRGAKIEYYYAKDHRYKIIEEK